MPDPSQHTNGLTPDPEEKSFFIVELGKAYPIRELPIEGNIFTFVPGFQELCVVLPSLTHLEVDAFQDATWEFALYAKRELVVLLFDVPSFMGWSDAPFSIHLVPPPMRALPAFHPDRPHAALSLILIDGLSTEVKGLRLVSFSPAFTKALIEAIQSQAKLSFDPARYDRAMEDLYRRFPLVSDLLPQTIARCKGGD